MCLYFIPCYFCLCRYVQPALLTVPDNVTQLASVSSVTKATTYTLMDIAMVSDILVKIIRKFGVFQEFFLWK